MSRTIKAIERDMVLPVRPGRQNRRHELVADWQRHGPETLSGLAIRKLRLSFASPQSVLIASAAG